MSAVAMTDDMNVYLYFACSLVSLCFYVFAGMSFEFRPN